LSHRNEITGTEERVGPLTRITRESGEDKREFQAMFKTEMEEFDWGRNIASAVRLESRRRFDWKREPDEQHA